MAGATVSEAGAAATAGGRVHVFTFQVRFSDIDSFQHVNNVVFVRYLEDARTAMLFVDPVSDGGERFGGLVVGRHAIEYRNPLRFTAEPIRVETTVRDVSPVRFTLDYDIRDDETHYVRAESLIVAYDVPRGRPRRLTATEYAYLARYRAAP